MRRPGRVCRAGMGRLPALAPEVVDRVLARLAGASLLTFSVDGSGVSAHRLVMRVIRENLAASGLPHGGVHGGRAAARRAG